MTHVASGGIAPAELERQFEQYRRELTGYCYRMLGSAFDADDALQETMLRAWRSVDRFEGRSSLRSWLYRIATNVCLDMLRGKQRRARPMDLGPASTSGTETPVATRAEVTWLEPIPDAKVLSDTADPAELAVERDTIRLAFVAALQHLPARQRAVLILREVLRWQASEVAELLDTTVVSVNSALQRARATMAAADLSAGAGEPTDDEQRELLARYIDAFERFDIDSLVSLLHDDAVMSMPPFEMWVQGREALRAFNLGPGAGCRGSRLVPVSANGLLGFAQYRSDGQGGYVARAIHLLDMSNGRVSALNVFINDKLFPLFGLPSQPPG